MAALSGTDGTVQVANSMVPPGIPGRSDADFLPKYDPADARQLLAEAGYPGGAGFPTTILMTGGAGFDEAIVGEVKRELGITLRAETMGDGYFDRLATDPPAMWSLGWVADYPGRNDFLGVLLGTGASNNYGALELAGLRRGDRRGRLGDRSGRRRRRPTTGPRRSSATRCRSSRRRTARAGRCRGPGCSGAGQNGLGIVRMAGLAWAD